MPKSLPALDSPSAVDPPQPGVKPADYRLVYEHLQQQVEERRTMTGKRLKDMRTEQEKKKASRCVQVIAPNEVHRRRSGPRASGQIRGQPAKQQSGVKSRILKKLHIGGPVNRALHHPMREGAIRPPPPRPHPVPVSLPLRVPAQGRAGPSAVQRIVNVKSVPKRAREQLAEDDIFMKRQKK